jgi:hypothetical protein
MSFVTLVTSPLARISEVLKTIGMWNLMYWHIVNYSKIVRFEVSTAVTIKIMFFWVLVPCGLIGRCQHFGETYCLHLEGWSDDAEGHEFFKLGVIATGGQLPHQATCPLWKGFWLGGSLGVEPRSVGIALADGLCDFVGKSLWLKASMIGEGRPCPFWIIP